MSTVNLRLIEDEVKLSQESVTRLLDNEERAKQKLAEIAAIPDILERLEAASSLVLESEALAELAKNLSDTANRAKKRMEGVVEEIKVGLLDEVRSAGGEVETKNFALKIRFNPPSVVVNDLEKVPKKYRLEPKPLPEWPEWPVDKNAVKQALLKEKVQSIVGISLEIGERIDIKSR